MKKVLLSLLAVLVAVPAFAVEFTSGDFKARIYGAMYADGFYTYGNDWTSPVYGFSNGLTYKDGDHMFGSKTFAGSSKLGVELSYGNVSGQFEAGINEPIRKFFLKYKFNGADDHYMVIGKDTTIATYYFGQVANDYLSLNYYGTLADTRKLQFRYGIKGFEMAIIMPHMGYSAALNGFSGSSIDQAYNDDEIDNASNYNMFDALPRVELAYTYSNDIAMIKVFGAYGATLYQNKVDSSNDKVAHYYHIGLGGKVNFGDGFMHFTGWYGQNIYLMSGLATGNPISAVTQIIKDAQGVEQKVYTGDLDVNNVQSAGGAIGFGYNALDGKIVPQIGVGYAANFARSGETTNDDSLGAYLNCTFKINDWFSVVPEISLFHDNLASDGKYQGYGIMAGVMAALEF